MDTILIIILILIPLGSWLTIKIKNKKYKKILIKKELSGFEVARKIIDNYDLNNIYITESQTSIISEYDSNRKVIRLKKGLFNDTSITSCAIAAREAAHAIQDKKKHKLYNFRKTINQLLMAIMFIGYLILVIGAVFGHYQTIYIGIGLEYVVLLFHICTLKIEKDANIIALEELKNNKIVGTKELSKIKEVLDVEKYIYIASIIYPITIL